MTENARFLFVIDNGEPIFYDLSKKGKMDMNETEDMLNKLSTEKNELKEKLDSISDIIDEQIWQVNHTHENCKKVGIAELKKLKKVLILNCIIKEELQK